MTGWAGLYLYDDGGIDSGLATGRRALEPALRVFTVRNCDRHHRRKTRYMPTINSRVRAFTHSHFSNISVGH